MSRLGEIRSHRIERHKNNAKHLCLKTLEIHGTIFQNWEEDNV